MGFYSKYVLPTLTDLAMRSHMLRPERARWVPLAKGAVLEIGVGSGLNLPMYGREVRKLYALDPSEELLRRARSRAARAAFAVEFLCRPAEAIRSGRRRWTASSQPGCSARSRILWRLSRRCVACCDQRVG